MAYQERFAVAVFCGSRAGVDPQYTRAAAALGKALAAERSALVYGGAQVGMMGAVADAALWGGAKVLGVLPEGLSAKEIAHAGLTELRIVQTLHERKAIMAFHADAFIAMPGGFGTLDELFEALTWRQLRIHHKPLGLLNTHGYFDALLSFIRHAVTEGFVAEAHEKFLVVEEDPVQLLQALRAQAVG